jgi:hypothetical protein
VKEAAGKKVSSRATLNRAAKSEKMSNASRGTSKARRRGNTAPSIMHKSKQAAQVLKLLMQY